MLCVVSHSALAHSDEHKAKVEPLHTYGNSLGQEVDTVIAISASKLLPLLPPGYNVVPAAALGFGGPDQGLVVIVDFRGFDPTIDHKKPLKENLLTVDVAILVFEPGEAAHAGVNIPGAFHLYALAIHTNDARYAESLHRADIPVEFVKKIGYHRHMDDATGVGDLIVSVPSEDSPFQTFSSGQGYVSMAGDFNAVFWHDGRKGKAVLHFRSQNFRQGTAISRIYTQPDSAWDALFDGGGLGPCEPHPETGYRCVFAPALNLRYNDGTRGRLLLIR